MFFFLKVAIVEDVRGSRVITNIRDKVGPMVFETYGIPVNSHLLSLL